MLDRAKLMRALRGVSDSLFVAHDGAYAFARSIWERIAHDPALIYKLRSAEQQWPLPWWEGAVGQVMPVDPTTHSYIAIAVDGSQVYPDRHQGTACFLLNIGSVAITYGSPSGVRCSSEPSVFTGGQEGEMAISMPEMVDCLRQEYELAGGVRLSSAESTPEQQLVLFDGSLIFWHLAGQSEEVKKRYMLSYCQLLEQFYNNKTMVAWYISLPKSKELVNIVRCAAAVDKQFCTQQDQLAHVLDTTLASFFLTPSTRTTVFKSAHEICNEYPAHLQPYFFYMHVGTEIARIEIPAWIAADTAAVDAIARLSMDQALKGRGYPVVLAEAHEQAVVKGPDRDFFYQLITKMSIEQQQRLMLSQKSMKKRGLNI